MLGRATDRVAGLEGGPRRAGSRACRRRSQQLHSLNRRSSAKDSTGIAPLPPAAAAQSCTSSSVRKTSGQTACQTWQRCSCSLMTQKEGSQSARCKNAASSGSLGRRMKESCASVRGHSRGPKGSGAVQTQHGRVQRRSWLRGSEPSLLASWRRAGWRPTRLLQLP